MEELVILIDEHDNEVGADEKRAAHVQCKLHRAFSVFVFDGEGRMLIQRRAAGKYHSAGLWANTCCGHPRPGETTTDAAHRRLGEEMGFDCPLTAAFSFTYKAELDNGLWEHEYDHVLVGQFGGTPIPNPEEVDEWRWVAVDDAIGDVKANPDRYAVWFRIALDEFGASRLAKSAGKAPRA